MQKINCSLEIPRESSFVSLYINIVSTWFANTKLTNFNCRFLFSYVSRVLLGTRGGGGYQSKLHASELSFEFSQSHDALLYWRLPREFVIGFKEKAVCCRRGRSHCALRNSHSRWFHCERRRDRFLLRTCLTLAFLASLITSPYVSASLFLSSNAPNRSKHPFDE